jgi:hypothetical protein
VNQVFVVKKIKLKGMPQAEKDEAVKVRSWKTMHPLNYRGRT